MLSQWLRPLSTTTGAVTPCHSSTSHRLCSTRIALRMSVLLPLELPHGGRPGLPALPTAHTRANSSALHLSHKRALRPAPGVRHVSRARDLRVQVAVPYCRPPLTHQPTGFTFPLPSPDADVAALLLPLLLLPALLFHPFLCSPAR